MTDDLDFYWLYIYTLLSQRALKTFFLKGSADGSKLSVWNTNKVSMMPHSRLKIEKKVQKQNYWFQCCLICTQKFIHFQKRSQKRKRPFLALKVLLVPDLTCALKNCLYSALIPKYFLLTSLFFSVLGCISSSTTLVTRRYYLL